MNRKLSESQIYTDFADYYLTQKGGGLKGTSEFQLLAMLTEEIVKSENQIAPALPHL